MDMEYEIQHYVYDRIDILMKKERIKNYGHSFIGL